MNGSIPEAKTFQDVIFNPTMGLKGKDGKVLSPAIGLWHELGHVYGTVFETQEAMERSSNKYGPESENADYHNEEEMHVIKNYEVPLAEEHDQLQRQSHGTRNVDKIKTESSISTIEVE
jgi:hypothetical protein